MFNIFATMASGSEVLDNISIVGLIGLAILCLIPIGVAFFVVKN